MDPRLLQQKRSAYQSRTVRLDQSIFQRIGLIKSRVHLKIADYYISCVPYDLSLETCRAIAVLGPREIAFFGEYREGTHNLHLSFDSPLFGREISLFAKVRLAGIRQPNPESSVCLIDLSLVTVPNDLAEILVTLIEELDAARSAYDEATARNRPVPLDTVYPAWPYRTVAIERDGESLSRCARIVDLAPHRMRVFVDAPGPHPEAGTSVEITSQDDDGDLYLRASVVESAPSEEVPGCIFLDCALEFSPTYVDRIRAAMPAQEALRPAESAQRG